MEIFELTWRETQLVGLELRGTYQSFESVVGRITRKQVVQDVDDDGYVVERKTLLDALDIPREIAKLRSRGYFRCGECDMWFEYNGDPSDLGPNQECQQCDQSGHDDMEQYGLIGVVRQNDDGSIECIDLAPDAHEKFAEVMI